MRRWKLTGTALAALAATLALAAACDGDGAPDRATPSAGPGRGTATAVGSPAAGSPAAACVPVEAAKFETSIDIAAAIPEGKIAFLSFRDEFNHQPNREIYLMSSDGTGPVNLTRNSCADDEPDLSPDGTRIAWESDRTGDFEIFAANVDGSSVQQLTNGGGLAPRWSTDGTMIAYSRGAAIWVMNADGTDPRSIMPAVMPSEGEVCETGGFAGGWSPDSLRVIYYAAIPASGTESGLGRICAVSLAGEVETLVSKPPVLNVEPVWSPDGRFVAFRSIRDGNSDVYVVDLEDGTETRLTDFEGLDIEPDWSPDGEWIVFGSNRDGIATDIYIMRRDGSDLRRLTDHEAKDSYPVWSP